MQDVNGQTDGQPADTMFAVLTCLTPSTYRCTWHPKLMRDPWRRCGQGWARHGLPGRSPSWGPTDRRRPPAEAESECSRLSSVWTELRAALVATAAAAAAELMPV